MKQTIIITLLCAAGVLSSCRTPPECQADVPQNLAEAHAQLLRHMPPEEVKEIEGMKSEDEMIRYHFGGGCGIRNSWGLWGKSDLAQYFNDIGIHHADDMSAIIMRTLWCKIHDKPFELERRVKYYQSYWRANAGPEPSTCADCGGQVDNWFIRSGRTNDEHWAVHVGDCEDCLKMWAYRYERGWYSLDAQAQEWLDQYKEKNGHLIKWRNAARAKKKKTQPEN